MLVLDCPREPTKYHNIRVQSKPQETEHSSQQLEMRKVRKKWLKNRIPSIYSVHCTLPSGQENELGWTPLRISSRDSTRMSLIQTAKCARSNGTTIKLIQTASGRGQNETFCLIINYPDRMQMGRGQDATHCLNMKWPVRSTIRRNQDRSFCFTSWMLV